PRMRVNVGIRRRLAPLMDNGRDEIELMHALLMSLPGSPVLYYGDEIGMGDNIYLGDRNGVRTPMQWNSDRNAGFSDTNPQRLYLPIVTDPEYHPQTVNVEAQQNNSSSLFWWMKRMIEHRKQYKAFGRGTIQFLQPENRKVLAFIRAYENERILVVANLSRYSQYVDLDLSEWQGMAPVEMFGRVRFPSVASHSYPVMLGPHSFYWFTMEPAERSPESITVHTDAKTEIPVVPIASFDQLTDDRTVQGLIRLLPSFLKTRRWYGSKSRTMTDLDVVDLIEVPSINSTLVLVKLEFTEGDPDHYVLPVSVARANEAKEVEARYADTIVARLEARDGTQGVLYGAVWNVQFRDALLALIRSGNRWKGRSGSVVGVPSVALQERKDLPAQIESWVARAEQSNTSLFFCDRFILKLFRKVESGLNPDIEISRYLTEQEFAGTPKFYGHLEYRRSRDEVWHLGILQQFVPNEGDAWKYTLDSLSQFYEEALASKQVPPKSDGHVLDLVQSEPPPVAQEFIGSYLESARLLGQRTAEMHQKLAAAIGTDMAPEPFTDHYRQGLFHGFLSQANRSLLELRRAMESLPEPVAELALRVLNSEDRIRSAYEPFRKQRVQSQRIRHHGDFHLGQVLYTGKDFSIIDFEGEPARPLSERRLRRAPLRDVAGMLRSFQYASGAALFGQIAGVVPKPESLPTLMAWGDLWNRWVGAAFLKGYLHTAEGALFLPSDLDELRSLLDVFVMDKALYEVGYELRYRPDWVRIPLAGILQLVK
ncbi:MAG: putative maltokinase, partial [Bryobacteraceae bacterium]|nr:putative maltokinase [Bryobacteraceae bacterium]